jgi:hypothetical protein
MKFEKCPVSRLNMLMFATLVLMVSIVYVRL